MLKVCLWKRNSLLFIDSGLDALTKKFIQSCHPSHKNSIIFIKEVIKTCVYFHSNLQVNEIVNLKIIKIRCLISREGRKCREYIKNY